VARPGEVVPTAPLVLLRPIEAELAKLASNAMLASKVAMANELFEVCSRYGVDWSRVQPAVGLDRRIGPYRVQPADPR
jgi:UDPglucose 6-dehydrogenase